jgi:small-conductance mechanosensitive channel
MVFKRVVEQTIASSSPSFANMKLSLTGKIFPVLSQLLILTPDKMTAVVDALQRHVEWQELLVILYFGWTTVPLAHLIHEFVLKSNNKSNKNTHKDFEDTWLCAIATLFSQAVRLLLLVFGADCAAICLTALGFSNVTTTFDLGSITARLVYTVWIAMKLAHVKTLLLAKTVADGASTTTTGSSSMTVSGEPMGKAAVLDKLLNVVVAVITLLFLADIFNIRLGSGGASICVLGAMQALVIFMASKDLVEQFRKFSVFILVIGHALH